MRKVKEAREFDFSSSLCRPVALRIAYTGNQYHGFSTSDSLPTIEINLFNALQKSKLINKNTQCAWAKSGRTDKGVSATGQTVSLYIRSAITGVKWNSVPDLENYKHIWNRCMSEVIDGPQHSYEDISKQYNLENRTSETLQESLKIIDELNNNPDSNKNELDYLTMINRLLPDDIRFVLN
jgi:tRNA pseudouridine38/39 synthase